MAALSLRRVAPYLVGGVLVLAVGGWTLSSVASDSGSLAAVALSPAVSLEAEPSTPSVSGGAPASALVSSTVSTQPENVFVQVAGAVRRPGVYEVPRGSRVFEVLARAGGVTSEGEEQSLALAGVVTDGMRLYVPAAGEAPPVPSSTEGAATPPNTTQALAEGTPVSLNSATAAELESLPGIGPKTAERIVAYRDSNGPFSSVEDLDEVPGIGPATVERLRGLVEP